MRKIPTLLLILPILASCGMERTQSGQTREQLVSSYAQLFRTLDKDHDGKLSRAEVGALVDHFMAVERQGTTRRPSAEVLARQRAQLMADFEREDTDHDGYLTLAEILSKPLAMVDCKDRNHLQQQASDEGSKAGEQCSSIEESGHQVRTP